MSITAISTLAASAVSIIERLVPDPNKKAEMYFRLEELKQKGDLAELSAYVTSLTGQLEINKAEASHKSVFVAGWRPFVGWVGGFSLLYMSIAEPLMRFVATLTGYQGDFPEIDTNITMQVLLGMLGVAGMRSFDKSRGIETDSIKRPASQQ